MGVEYSLDFENLLNNIDCLNSLSKEEIELRNTLECLYKINCNENYFDEFLTSISTKNLLSAYIELVKKNKTVLNDMALGELLKDSINSSQEVIEEEEVWL